MEPQALQLGFIGGGLNSAIGMTHKIAAQMDGRWRLEAGCFSLNSEVNVQTAQAYGVDRQRLYSNWRDLLKAEKDSLDAVVVLTPTPSHVEVIIPAIEAGYAVLSEKALASSSSDAGRIRRAVERRNTFLAVTYNYTGYPMLRELKRMIQDGQLGKLNQILLEMPQEGYIRRNQRGEPQVPQAWRLKDDALPTISLDLGVHLHHLTQFLSQQRPLELVATQDTFGAFPQVIDNTMCIARYSGGLVCQIWYSKSALGHRNGLQVRVYGDKGSAQWYQMQPEFLNCTDSQGKRFVIDRASQEAEISSQQRYTRFKAGHPAGFIEAFANHYYDLADSLTEFKKSGRHSSPWVFNVQQAEEGLLMLEAISRSARSRSWEAVRSIDHQSSVRARELTTIQ